MKNITDKVGKFTSHEFQLEKDLNPRDLIIIQGECEVIDVTEKPIGEEDELKKVCRIRAKAIEMRQINDGIVSEPSYTTTNGKSLSKQLRSVLYIYWDQQLRHKYNSFESFYQVAMEVNINKVKEKLV
jgi:hypothetical protein